MHVLLEKPMAISPKECRDIIDATDRAGVTFTATERILTSMLLRTLPIAVTQAKNPLVAGSTFQSGHHEDTMWHL